MTETIKFSGGDHILARETLLSKNIEESTKAEINAEKENFMTT